MRRLLVLGLMIVSPACEIRRAVPAASAATEERALRDRVAQYYRDMSARDWGAYRGHFWPGATLALVWQVPLAPAEVTIMTIEQFLARTAEGPDSKPIFEERLLGQEVRMSGNLAQVWARYEARFGDSVSVDTWRGVDAFSWLKHGGEWRITSLTFANEDGEPPGSR